MDKNRFPLLRQCLSVLIVLSVLLAALPQPVQAATCASYYYVKAGDTTVSIAQHFGLKWREIAKANKLEYPYKLKVGQRLCIPPKETEEESEDATKFKVTINATRSTIIVTVSGLNVKKATFNVRARNANTGVGGWTLLGRLRAKKSTTTRMLYAVPDELQKVTFIQVCLKNVTTDELDCKTIVHP
jgi:LysM repeat protein